MSDSPAPPKSCPQCGAALPAEAPDGLCPKCLMAEAMQPTIVSDASKPKTHSTILAPEDLAPFFPQYEILRMLGRGGMGAVYLARQISLNRLVAIKILPADMGGGDQGFAERFKNEAQAMAQLSHPGIVAVYDFGQTTNGLLYIVMEYIEGTDVQLMLTSQGRLHSAHAMAITAHVCDALQYAHTRGIIHRDIKPSNIMVSNAGVVKVADFGLAKMSQGQTTGLTQSGMAMGTPHFMAPETLTLGSAVDQRADIYAVGVMLYQMLTGKLPQGMFEMPSFQVPGLDPRYDRIVARALRDDREQRYQAAAELRHDLDAILTQPVEKTTPDAEEVKGLPPVEERGRKKARVPNLLPQVASPAPAGKKPVGLIFMVLGVVAALVAVLFHFRDHGVERPSSVNPDLAEATKEQPFVNSLGMKFVPVPGTDVLMCIHETRKTDYAVFAKTVAGLDDSWEKPADQSIAPGEAGNHPVVNVNEADAMAFCAWLGSKDGLVYRLPTDHEWSCAVGIGDREDATMSPKNKAGRIQKVYPWGSVWPPPAGAGNFADSSLRASTLKSTLHTVIEGYTDGVAGTAPVMSFPPNQLGIYDLAGNVWELCSDWYDSPQTMKTKRGGCWDNAPEGDLLSCSRLPKPAEARSSLDGFRVVVERRTLPASASSDVQVSSSPSSATKEVPFTNTLGMKFVPVPIGGGPTKGEHVIFSVWDTRVQDYLEFARANKVDSRWQEQQKDGVPIGRELDHPVAGVSWDDAQAFCKWLTAKETAEGTLPPGMKYRLPSDEEWSWAVGLPSEPGATPAEKRGKNGADFPWGIGFLQTGKEGNYSDEAYHAKFLNLKKGWFVGYNDGHATTSPVGSFPANAYGLYDMGGNVWQWCEDWFDKDQKERVLRGGSWGCGGRLDLLSSSRKNCEPGIRGFDQGFRCVLASASNVSSASPSLPVSQSSPTTATKESPFTNTLGMKFVPVPITGGPTDKQRVLFSIWETRVQDYGAFARETRREWPRTDFVQGQTHPAVRTSWDDAQAFCEWLTEKERKEGRLNANSRYRLPTDHEWSCAAGIGEKEDVGMTPAALGKLFSDAFPWGNAWPPPAGAGNYFGEEMKPAFAAGTYKSTRVIEGYRDGFVATAPSGSFQGNRFGLHDLGGNAWEWCEDWYDEKKTERVQRGASWLNGDQSQALLATRGKMPSDTRNPNVGFRCVLEIEAVTTPAVSSDTAHATPTTKIEEASVEHPFENTLGMKFVPMPNTNVLMCIHETRFKDYEAYAREQTALDGSWQHRTISGYTPTDRVEDHPVTNVNWNDATAFCAWLGEKEGITYRLPSDREWSVAVGIGDDEKWDASTTSETVFKNQTDYPWGTQWPIPSGSGNYSDQSRKHLAFAGGNARYIEGYEDGFPLTSPVMSFRPNKFGFYDLGGNVLEWCVDWFDAHATEHVWRGASWWHDDRDGGAQLRSSSRGHYVPELRGAGVGFRVVIELPSATPKTATQANPFENTLGMKFVPVPITGGPTDKQRVLFCIWETRVQDYEVFAKETKRVWPKAKFPQEPTHPVVNMSWEDAQAFCAWLTQSERLAGKIGADVRYRLPHDHEWSCAVGIADREDPSKSPSQKQNRIVDVFPWGTAWPPPQGVGNFADESAKVPLGKSEGDYIEGHNDGFPWTAPVGSFPADKHGLFDMSGNAHEYSEDEYLPGQSFRTGRGGSFDMAQRTLLQSSNRSNDAPNQNIWNRGFRIVLAPQ